MTRRERDAKAREQIAGEGASAHSERARRAASMTRPRRSRQDRSGRKRGALRVEARRTGTVITTPAVVKLWQGPTKPRGCWRSVLVGETDIVAFSYTVPRRNGVISDRLAHRYSALGRAR